MENEPLKLSKLQLSIYGLIPKSLILIRVMLGLLLLEKIDNTQMNIPLNELDTVFDFLLSLFSNTCFAFRLNSNVLFRERVNCQL